MIGLGILALFLGAIDNVWLALYWASIANLIAVWCCAVWLIREGSLVYTSGTYPSPRSSRILSRSKTISGTGAKLHGLVAMVVGALLSLVLPVLIFWLANGA
jgi:hypothetical protein